MEHAGRTRKPHKDACRGGAPKLRAPSPRASAISGLLAIAGGIAAIALIRRKDFVVHAEAAPPAGDAKSPAPDAVGAGAS